MPRLLAQRARAAAASFALVAGEKKRPAAVGAVGSRWPLRCTSQKRGKASLQIIDLLAN